MAVLTDWTRGYSGPQGTYYYTIIDAPNATTEFTNKFPFELPGPYAQVTLYSADGANFANNCSLDAYAVMVETDVNGDHTEANVKIGELIAAAAQGADPVISQCQIENFPSLGFKFGVVAAADASADDAVVGVFIPNMKI